MHHGSFVSVQIFGWTVTASVVKFCVYAYGLNAVFVAVFRPACCGPRLLAEARVQVTPDV